MMVRISDALERVSNFCYNIINHILEILLMKNNLAVLQNVL